MIESKEPWRERLPRYCEFHHTVFATHTLRHADGHLTYLYSYCAKGGSWMPKERTLKDVEPL
ncbi:MAG: hypothetical protein V4449_01725 [Patescibacteria group bacterium]